MKTAKLIVLTFPVVVAFMLLVANPAKASIVKSAPTESHLALTSAAQADSETVTPDSSDNSNPITDQLGCSCSSCVKARLELQGKLPISSNL
ncbi:MAG: hypothetical protein KME30_30065 [Iphinoe sp. HA4291-MV1]|jgi:hypothetical protein|nr:hypothetical protein [Iphinoe sp. HA4291-MV1]